MFVKNIKVLNMKNYISENFNESKAINAVLYVSNKLKRKDFHKIFKVLYFADRNHLSEYGRSITGDTYIAMNDGPVPSKIYDIFKSVRGDSYFKDTGNFSAYFSVENWDIIRPVAEPNLKVLSKTDLEYLEDSLKEYGFLSWDEVREKSHDYAWRNTPLNTPITIDNFLLETGSEDSYIGYVKDNINFVKSFQ